MADEIRTARAVADPGAFDIWWLGQSGFLLHWNGRMVLFDPYLSDSLTEKYAATDKPHVRMSERVMDPGLLTGIDIVTSSHNHTDHLDAATLNTILAHNPGISMVIPEANRDFVADRLGFDRAFPFGIDDRKQVTIGEFTFTGVPAAHNDIERDAQGRCCYLGYLVRFGKWTVFHSGDTLYHDGLVDILSPAKPDVAFLPINGNDPARRVAGNMNGAEAARLAREVGARMVIPHHFHLFEFNTAEPDLFEASCQSLKQLYITMKLGERLHIDRQTSN
ncbi:MAG: MBL fold metallo-hydrolase [Bacteroidota bacterium]